MRHIKKKRLSWRKLWKWMTNIIAFGRHRNEISSLSPTPLLPKRQGVGSGEGIEKVFEDMEEEIIQNRK